MAKVNGLIELSGTIGALTFVNSLAYPPHVRRKRGTLTKIILSDGMKQSAINLTFANQRAQLIYTPLKLFANGFIEGRLWSQLIKNFRKQQKDKQAYTFTTFHRTELRTNYQTNAHAYFELIRNVENEKVTLKFSPKPMLEIREYEVHLLRIATDRTLKTAYPIQIMSDKIRLGSSDGSISLAFEQLQDGARVIYCLKCEKLINGQKSNRLADKGMVLLTG